MSFGWLDPHFTTVATALALIVVAYLVCVEPILGRRLYAELVRTRDRDPDALQRFYQWILVIEWAATALALAVIVIAPGIQPQHLGLAWPAGEHTAIAGGFALSAGITIFLTGLLLRRRARRGQTIPAQQRFSALLPRTRIERRMALGVAVTAGTCEELLYRGLMIATGVGFFGLSPYLAATVAVVSSKADRKYTSRQTVVTALDDSLNAQFREGAAYAQIGDASAFRTAITQARRELDRGSHPADPPWCGFIMEPEIDGHEAAGQLCLGFADQSIKLYERVLDGGQLVAATHAGYARYEWPPGRLVTKISACCTTRPRAR